MSDPSKSYYLEQRIIQAIQTIPDEKAMLSDVVSILGQEFCVDTCLIVSGFNEQQLFDYAIWTVDNSCILSQEIVANLLSQPWLQELDKDNQLLAISDLSNTPNKRIIDSFNNIDLASLLAIKTQFHGEYNGIILLANNNAFQWSNTQKNILKNVSNLIGIACYLMQLKLSVSEDLTSQESSKTSSLTGIPKVLEDNPILKLWWGATRKQLDQQLEWNKQLISNIITIMSDQTRNPLASIKMGITMLRKKEFSPEDLQKRLNILEQEWQKLNEINEQILQLKTVKYEQLTCYPTQVDIKHLIEELATDYKQKWQDNKRQILDLEVSFAQADSSNWKIYTDVNHVKNILTELLNNIGKFSIPNSKVFLNISQENLLNDPQIVITLKNVSNQVNQKNLRYFFEPFYREQWVIDTAIQGIGLGLTIVKELVELLGGKIEINKESTDNPEHCIIKVRLTVSNSHFSSGS
ncbi:MAG TPA: histidine kinase [Cyanothece sp. UBA12306]|nr:histidine kinase [Cyanothece sp. UBA12306]